MSAGQAPADVKDALRASPAKTILALVLIVTGMLKTLDGNDVDHVSRKEPLLALLSNHTLLVTAGILEIILGVALFSRYWKTGLFAVAILVIAFWFITLAAFLSEADPSTCGCIGPITLNYSSHFALLAGLYLFILAAWLQGERNSRSN